MTTPTPLAPKFDASKPWHVSSFKVEAGKLCVETTDSSGTTGTLDFDVDALKLIQFVRSNGPTSPNHKLYAEVRLKAKWIQHDHQITYLGDVNEIAVLQTLQTQLKNADIDWVWYPTPRKERINDLLPKAWKPKIG